jgi:hypothetical protein
VFFENAKKTVRLPSSINKPSVLGLDIRILLVLLVGKSTDSTGPGYGTKGRPSGGNTALFMDMLPDDLFEIST